MDWQAIISQGNLVGNDLAIHRRSNDILRGPIKSIGFLEGDVLIEFEWRALQDISETSWYLAGYHPLRFRVAECLPEILADGTVKFEIPFVGPAIIFPKNVSKLDVALIIGLR